MNAKTYERTDENFFIKSKSLNDFQLKKKKINVTE